MPLATAARVEVLGVLVRASRTARASLTAAACDRAIENCAGVAAVASTLPGDPALVVRDAAALLLAQDCPGLDAGLRDELAVAVAEVVVRRRTTA